MCQEAARSGRARPSATDTLTAWFAIACSRLRRTTRAERCACYEKRTVDDRRNPHGQPIGGNNPRNRTAHPVVDSRRCCKNSACKVDRSNLMQEYKMRNLVTIASAMALSACAAAPTTQSERATLAQQSQ